MVSHASKLLGRSTIAREAYSLAEPEGGAIPVLLDFDAHGKHVLQVIQVGYDDNLVEIMLYGADHVHYPLSSRPVLSAKPLVYEQGR